MIKNDRVHKNFFLKNDKKIGNLLFENDEKMIVYFCYQI